MAGGDIGQFRQFLVRGQPVFQAPGGNIGLFEQDIPEPGVTRDLDICQYGRIRKVHVVNSFRTLVSRAGDIFIFYAAVLFHTAVYKSWSYSEVPTPFVSFSV